MTDTTNHDAHTGTTTQGTTGNPASETPAAAQPKQGRTEEFRVSGEAVLAKVRELVHEGNVRRITIKNDDGKVLIEIPLTLGVIGTVLLPVWAAIGAIAALAANLTIAVERSDTPDKTAVEKQASDVTG